MPSTGEDSFSKDIASRAPLTGLHDLGLMAGELGPIPEPWWHGWNQGGLQRSNWRAPGGKKAGVNPAAQG